MGVKNDDSDNSAARKSLAPVFTYNIVVTSFNILLNRICRSFITVCRNMYCFANVYFKKLSNAFWVIGEYGKL